MLVTVKALAAPCRGDTAMVVLSGVIRGVIAAVEMVHGISRSFLTELCDLCLPSLTSGL